MTTDQDTATGASGSSGGTGVAATSAVGTTPGTSHDGTVTGRADATSSSATAGASATTGTSTGEIPWEELTEEECWDAGGWPSGAWPVVPLEGEPGYCIDRDTFIDYIGCSLEPCGDNAETTLAAEDAPDIPVYQVGDVCFPVGYVNYYGGSVPSCP